MEDKQCFICIFPEHNWCYPLTARECEPKQAGDFFPSELGYVTTRNIVKQNFKSISLSSSYLPSSLLLHHHIHPLDTQTSLLFSISPSLLQKIANNLSHKSHFTYFTCICYYLVRKTNCQVADN